ncbi:hypothetical protein Tco_1359254 [Tanacetum coccineum]
MKELPKHLEYAFLQENNQLPVVISSALSTAEKARLLENSILRSVISAKNLATDHHRLENPDLRKLTKAEIRDLFLEERLMEISNKNNEPWCADYANYLASRVLPFRSTSQKKQKFFSELRALLWDEPFLFK